MRVSFVGKRGEGINLFSMLARVVGSFVEEANVGGGDTEEGVPGGGGETSVRWCCGNKVSVS